MDNSTLPLPSLAKAQISANHHHTPKKTTSSPLPPLPDLEDEKRKLAQSVHSVWQWTGVPTVVTVASTLHGKPVTRFRIQLRKYSRGDWNGIKKVSSLFHSEHDANAAMFAFRYDHETKQSKDLVDQHVSCLESGDEPPEVPERKKIKLTARKTRAAAMTQNPAFRNSTDAPRNMNPKAPGSCNK